MKTVLVTGLEGYIGTAFYNYLKTNSFMDQVRIVGIDNGAREKWVREMGGCSLTDYPIIPSQIYELDLANYKHLLLLLEDTKPDVILHLASQPSGPYSELSLQHRLDTQVGNITMLSNLLHGAWELKLNPKFIVTTTTGIPGAPKGPILEEPMPILAGSAYHVSRGFDSANLTLAVRQFKFDILELRTSIVYGTDVEGMEGAATRFDWDFWFGTVINRFLLMKKLRLPAKIYGKGLQKKPIIHICDVVRSLWNAVISCDFKGHQIMNQVAECVSIVGMARAVGCEIDHIPNPRVENEEHQMEIKNEKFLNLLYQYNDPFYPNLLAHSLKKTLDHIDISKLPQDWRDVYDGCH